MSFTSYVGYEWDTLVGLGIGNLVAVLIALAIATFIGVTLGILTYRRPVSAQIVLAIGSTILTIPSFALFGIMIGIGFGLGYTPTIIVLTGYAILAILRNTITGLRSVDPAIIESAKGMGMSDRQQLIRIEIPMAWPVIIAGVRVSALLILGISAIAAYVGGPGFGSQIFDGLSQIGGVNSVNEVLSGMLGIIVLALIFEVFFAILGRFTTSKGLN